MTRPPTDREALIAALAAEARSTGTDGPDPEPEKLLDFLAGRLDPEEEERLSRHLLANPEASRALLDLADLDAAGAQAGDRPTDLAALAGWRDLERRLPSPAPSRSRRLRTLLPSIAAALLVSTVGLSTWVWRQGELNRPVANLPVANLPSLSLALIRTGAEPTAKLAPGAPLRLVIHPTVPCPGYEAVLEGPKPGERQTVPGLLMPDERELLSALLYPDPGSYTLRLYGCEPRQEVGDYRFRITPDGG